MGGDATTVQGRRWNTASWLASWLLIGASSGSLSAGENRQVILWPDSVPGQAASLKREVVAADDPRIGRRVTRVTEPTLTIYKPASNTPKTNTAVVVCPGGGYHILAYDLEGKEVAEWLNSIGVTALVLEYRVPRAKSDPNHQRPLMDAQRAIRWTRANAKSLGIDAKKIGILGFSAGGHLAVQASTKFATDAYSPVDDVDKQSARPDFSVLVYPAYMLKEKTIAELKPSLPVSEKTPPAIMIHTADDRVTCQSSIGYFLALRQAKVPAELHIYPRGGHGYGLRKSVHQVTKWPNLVRTWLNNEGWLATTKDE